MEVEVEVEGGVDVDVEGEGELRRAGLQTESCGTEGFWGGEGGIEKEG